MTGAVQLPICFHNSIKLQGLELEEAIQQCKSQEDRIFILMHKSSAKTPFEMQDIYNKTFNTNVPVTSIRRAFSNLEKQGRIVKLGIQTIEQFGKPNHKWIRVN